MTLDKLTQKHQMVVRDTLFPPSRISSPLREIERKTKRKRCDEVVADITRHAYRAGETNLQKKIQELDFFGWDDNTQRLIKEKIKALNE